MKSVGIGVGGRFHSDFMYRALHELGYSPFLYTSLPKNRFPQFAIPSATCVWPEVIYRLTKKIGFETPGDAMKMKYFGRFLSNQIEHLNPNYFVGWSSFSLETLKRKAAKFHILMRDSSHIQFQYDLLTEEHNRFGSCFPKRNFCLERELEEYALADHIWVLSDFAKNTFVNSGTSPEKIRILPLGVDLKLFKPIDVVTTPSPLRVIYFGILSFRKGVQYLLEATKDFSPKQIELNLIGAVEPDFKGIMSKYSHYNYRPAMPQKDLAKEIRQHHVFVFPTLEDGFGQTLIQAMASGLVPVTTEHCGSAGFTYLKNSPWRLPIRSAAAIKNCLEQLIDNPALVSQLRAKAIKDADSMTWNKYQAQLGQLLAS